MLELDIRFLLCKCNFVHVRFKISILERDYMKGLCNFLPLTMIRVMALRMLPWESSKCRHLWAHLRTNPIARVIDLILTAPSDTSVKSTSL